MVICFFIGDIYFCTFCFYFTYILDYMFIWFNNMFLFSLVGGLKYSIQSGIVEDQSRNPWVTPFRSIKLTLQIIEKDFIVIKNIYCIFNNTHLLIT